MCKMKKTIYLLVSIIALLSCKKESNIPSSTLPNPSNSSTCVDNPNINFTSIGTPIGKFGECIKDIDGNTYKTVTIGTQTWMAENLNVSKYNDGTSIPNVTDSLQWSKLTTGAWCNYNNIDSLGKIYGKLYNWYAVSSTTNGNKNVCPSGWHVPTDSEWTVLASYLGGENIAGGLMKEIGLSKWDTPNVDATNTSKFTAIPGGYKFENGNFLNIKKYGYWWSSTESDTYDSFNYILREEISDLDRDDINKKNGFSIRCLKD